MKLYQTIDGTLIGFYRERGGAVQAMLYRDVYESQLVTKTRDETITIPGYYRIDVTTVAGYWDEVEVYEPGHYERQMVWHPEYYVTRYYWREAHPARGLEAAWIPYRELIPAGEKETRVWVPGQHVTEEVWVPEQTISDRVWIPPEVDIITVSYQEFEQVWVGREPVYEYVDESRVRLFEVLDLFEGAGPGPEYEDVITIRNMQTGDELKTTAKYVGLATRIADNEYVVPYN